VVEVLIIVPDKILTVAFPDIELEEVLTYPVTPTVLCAVNKPESLIEPTSVVQVNDKPGIVLLPTS
jgi:hypothetical protein